MKKGNVEVEDLDGMYHIKMYGLFVRNILDKDMEDLHSILSELLDTHTVKEEGEMIRCEHGLIAGDECDCGKGYQKEEQTTPEKREDSPRPQGEDWKDGVKPQKATPEKSMTLPDGKEVSTSYSEIFDQDGKPIEGIIAIQALNGAIIVATAKKMYCNKPEIFKTSSSFEEVSTPEKKCTDLRHMGMGESFYCPSPIHQENLPTSSYEVTCGRCEKSIKHSCGL